MYIPEGFNHQYGIPLIMEVGSLNAKIGFSGKDRPDIIAPSYVQVSKANGQKSQIDFFQSYAKQNANPQSILQNCFIEDWQGFQTFTDFNLGKKLMLNPSQSPLFYIEPPLSSKQYRQKLIELFFEQYNFNGLFMHKAPVLSTYLFALESSLVVDVGAEYTHVVPVIEGFIHSKGIIRASVGGQTLTRELYKASLTHNQKYHNIFKNQDSLTKQMNQWGYYEQMRQVKHQFCHLLEFRGQNLAFNQHTDKTVYELPDKNKLVFGKQLFMVPQILFNERPEDNFKGIQHLIAQSLQKCEPQQRKELIPNIQLIGGCSSFSTMPDRLQRQLMEADFMGSGNKMKVFTTNQKSQRCISSWLGASIMSSMKVFDKWIVSKKQYEEHGVSQVQKRL